MGTVTGNVIKKLRPASRGGDQLGPCDECGKSMGEVFVAQSHREYRRENGELYTSPIGGGIYGHAACLQSYGPFANC